MVKILYCIEERTVSVYHSSRSGDVVSDFLKEYQGVVQTDGYIGYDFLDSKKHITHLGCMAHACRKFVAA